MSRGLRISFFGSSLISSYRNSPCLYYRGIIRALHERGHQVTFYEPDAFERQRHRDIADPVWARAVVYSANERAARRAAAAAADSDVVIKAGEIGVFDDLLADSILDLPGDSVRIFWDMDAPETLAELESGSPPPLRDMVPDFGLILTRGGGEPVIDRYLTLGARRCVPIPNALDTKTHFPVPHQAHLARDLVFLGDRLPDREDRLEEFFFGVAERRPHSSFLLGGDGWKARPLPPNVRYLGDVSTDEHNALNASPLAVLNVTREAQASVGFSPPTRIFAAAGAAACVITDAFEGAELVLEPGHEILIARDGAGVASLLDRLDRATARRIGRAARQRVLTEHTYAHRAEQVEALLVQSLASRA